MFSDLDLISSNEKLVLYKSQKIKFDEDDEFD